MNTSLGHTVSNTYDYFNRLLTSVATASQTGGAAYNLTFSYDRYGNMTCVQNAQTNGPCPQWTFSSASNQITSSAFSYDPAGNLIGDGTHTYQWHAEGWLRGVDGNNTAGYVYNALGWRVEKKVGRAYTEILYDQSGESLGEYNRSAWTQSYVNPSLRSGQVFMGRHLAIYTNGQTGATYFPHPNALGSTTAVTDYTGALVEDKLFYPWGQDWQVVGTLYEERFAKLQHRDSETSLDPTPNRMFSSQEGRWLSPDPMAGYVSSPQSLNRYAYVANNPATLSDPFGLVGGCVQTEDGLWCPPVGNLGGGSGGGRACTQFVPGNFFGGALRPMEGNCGSGVPGSGSGPSGLAVDAVSNRLATKDLTAYFKTFGKSHCAQVFAKVLGSAFTVSAFENLAFPSVTPSSINYWNPYQAPFANYTQNQVTGNGNSTRLWQTFSETDAQLPGTVALTLNGPTGSAVLLGPDFFFESHTQQGFDLVHEVLHAFLYSIGKPSGDPDIFKMFGPYGCSPANSYGDTSGISAWIANNCY